MSDVRRKGAEKPAERSWAFAAVRADSASWRIVVGLVRPLRYKRTQGTTMPPGQDARIRELRLLAKVDRVGCLEIPSTQDLDGPERSMIIEFIYDRYLSGIGSPPWVSENDDLPPCGNPAGTG